MGVSSQKLIFLCCSLFMASVADAEGGQVECYPTKCKHHGHGPVIKFPFWLRGSQPDRCGFPGFELSCSENKDTVLVLPHSVKLFVKYIHYRHQKIGLYDPDGCLIKQILNLTISASSFFIDEYYAYPQKFSLFNCTSRHRLSSVSCLSNIPDYQVYAVRDDYYFPYNLLSCERILDIAAPWDIMLNPENNYLRLKWTRPMCTKCEEEGKACRATRNSTGAETECFYMPEAGLSKTQIAGLVVGLCPFLLVVFAINLALLRSKREAKLSQLKIKKFLEDYKAVKPARYSYSDIKKITKQFKEKLGQGAYGTVFKGNLSDDVAVAVKILNSSQGNGNEFINEVGSMGRIHHINIARLVGFCADGSQRALVYEYLPNESLEKYIFSTGGRRQVLGWKKLQEIALGIAKGIEYLHQGCDQRILHFDIKPHNILLDHNFNPKISDFGLAKLCSKDHSTVSMTAARGTIGYIAPEVVSRNFGNVSHKSDVYSFGMLLLEIVGGRKNSDNTSEIFYPEWIYKQLVEGENIGIADEEEGHTKIAKKLATVGLWCIQWYPADRPPMSVVIQMLEGGDNLTVPPNPFATEDSVNRPAPTMPGRAFQLELEIIPEI